MKFHPAANTFPMLDKQRYSELLADIRENGQLQPITICDGMILDGRNRWKACVELGIAPATRDFNGNPWTYAWSLNGQRRDLTEIQRGAIKLLCDRGNADYLAKQKAFRAEIDANANKARSEAAKGNDNASKEREKTVVVPKEPALNKPHEQYTPAMKQVVVPKEPAPAPVKETHKGRSSRAAAAGVSPSVQAKVEAIANHSEDMLEKLASGEIGGAEARRQMKRDQVAEKVAALPDGQYRVIYADPPWSYGDKRHGDTMMATGAEHHYPTMALSELKALDVPSLCADDAVMFLWATCPLLEDALELCRAWGFKYKAQFVWDKIKHNMGHYNSVRHELLLICTKGSCTPENVKLYDSVQSIERTEHSRKPEEFRSIIETLFPSGAKIELFRRGDAIEGWDTWGNEA